MTDEAGVTPPWCTLTYREDPNIPPVYINWRGGGGGDIPLMPCCASTSERLGCHNLPDERWLMRGGFPPHCVSSSERGGA